MIAVLVQPKHLKGELLIDAYLKVGFTAGFFCAVAGVTFIWLWEFQAQWARRKQMRVLANGLGFSYAKAMSIPADLLTTYPLFVEFGYVYPNVQNALSGKIGKFDVCVFDYRHPEYLSSGGGQHSGQIWKFFDTVVVLRGADRKPHAFTFGYGLAVTDIKPKLDVLTMI